MIAEGTIADGPNGQTATFLGGKWVIQGSAAMSAYSPADQKRVADLRTEADSEGRVAGLANDFMGLNKKTATGPAYAPLKIPVPFVGSVNVNPLHGIANATDPNIGSMESITNRAAVQLRPPGSGPLRNVELANFMKAFPNTQNMGNTNDQIKTQLNSEASTRRAYADFMSKWLGEHGTLNGADPAWQASRGAAAQNAQQQPSGSKIRTYNPKTGNLE